MCNMYLIVPRGQEQARSSNHYYPNILFTMHLFLPILNHKIDDPVLFLLGKYLLDVLKSLTRFSNANNSLSFQQIIIKQLLCTWPCGGPWEI